MFPKILVAMDSTEVGKYVFEQALSLASSTKASLILLHVLSPYEAGYPEDMPLSNPDASQDEVIRQYMEKLAIFKEQGLNLLRDRSNEAIAAGVNTQFTQQPGTPGYVICDLARTWGADLIIIGHQSSPKLNELILGSVSNYVTHHTPCSILVVHPQLPSASKSDSSQSGITNALN